MLLILVLFMLNLEFEFYQSISLSNKFCIKNKKFDAKIRILI